MTVLEQALDEYRQHSLELIDLRMKSIELLSAEVAEVAREQEIILKPACGTDRDPTEAKQIAPATSAPSAMFAGTADAAGRIWLVNPNASSRGNVTVARYTSGTA